MTKPKMTASLRKYLTDWLAWVDAGAPEHKVFCRSYGLCIAISCADYATLKGLLLADGLNGFYPFGGEERYLSDRSLNRMHLNKQRVAWVRATLAKYPARKRKPVVTKRKTKRMG